MVNNGYTRRMAKRRLPAAAPTWWPSARAFIANPDLGRACAKARR
jgi:hypothetical protein